MRREHPGVPPTLQRRALGRLLSRFLSQPGEWLAEHPGSGQTLTTRLPDFFRPDTKDKIYLQP
jgi:hypothetical protein